MLARNAISATSIYHKILGTTGTFPLRLASTTSVTVTSASVVLCVSNACARVSSISAGHGHARHISTSVQDYAARKGTREKREKLKKKRKKEPEVKKTFIQKLMEQKAKVAHILQRPPDNSHLPQALDDVYFYQKFQDKIWTFVEAIQNHRDFLHPTLRNFPQSQVLCRIDIDLVYPNRPNKMMEGWKSLVEMKSPFVSAGTVMPKILAFCLNDHESIASVLQAGAETAGSNELIKSIQEGHISLADYDHVIAHPLMVIELTSIRGLLKRKFPSTKAGTVDIDLVPVVRKLRSGIKIELQRTEREPDFAWIECSIGKLDMSVEDLEANFMAVMKDTLPRRVAGKLPQDFIVQCSLLAGHTTEKFILDKEHYIAICDSKPEVATTPSRKGGENRSKILSQKQELGESKSTEKVEKGTTSATAAAS